MQEDNYFIQNRQYITGLESLFIQASQKLVGAWIKNDSHPVIYRRFRIKQLPLPYYCYKCSTFEPYKKEAHHV